jgi:hypothetical protein
MIMIPVPVDVVGRTVSFRPTASSSMLQGEVADVYFRMGVDPRYPKGSKGYNNGMRQLYKRMSVVLPDGRIFNLNAEHEDIKKMEMVADNSNHDHIW